MKKAVKRAIKISHYLALAIAVYALAINFYVILYGSARIAEPGKSSEKYDCILVLGCSVKNGEPSDMLRDRLDRAVELYKSGVSDCVFMTGNGIGEYYDEVTVMKNYAVKNGVPESAVTVDPYGLSTYESMYNAKNTFGFNKMMIVTQKYHLFRSIYIAGKFGMKADGTPAMPNTYIKQPYFSAREFMARNKDFLYCLFKPVPQTIKGDKEVKA